MCGNKARTWVEVDLEIFRKNLDIIRKHVGETIKIMAVVKADAYGHGASQFARVCQDEKIDFLAVACVKEGIALRKDGIKLPVLILSYVDETEVEEMIEYNLIPTVYDEEMAVKLNSMCGDKQKIKIHIKLDTGMTRLGFSTLNPERTVAIIEKISKMPNIEIDGIFTHYADSDNRDLSYCNQQYERFNQVINLLQEKNINIPNKHTCNSAAVITEKDKYLDMVRCGIILYGCYPDNHLEEKLPGLLPPLGWKARLSYVRTVEEDITVSYGRTCKVPAGTPVGVVSVGYADGYSRLLSNKFYCLINGRKAPVIGRVCMDQLMVDLSDVPDAQKGNVVTLIGKDGDLTITATDMADVTGTISYEILCDISGRVDRVYV
ncbi:MAG: alanine racemase [Ruminococcaceae bacterium]|nr:alanine racemase [Oscillospiraceae bacterium]